MAAPKKAPPPETPAQRREKLRRQRLVFSRARRAELDYGRRLREVAKQVASVVRGFGPQGIIAEPSALTSALRHYAEVIRPWATAVAARMVADVARRDAAAWAEHARNLGTSLRREIATAPTGALMRQRLADQVTLITSLPLDAAERVHRLTVEARMTGVRAEETAKRIMATGEVTRSRANLIARTETARTAAELTRARAIHIGSEGYIWRTSRDANVRHLHRKLEGTYHKWDAPPVAGESGERAHPGSIYNCRCTAEVVLPEV